MSAGQKQSLIAIALLLLAVVYGIGAVSIPGDAGYGGAGPNFLPWVVTAGLAAFGAGLLWQALRGGWQGMDVADDVEAGANWPCFAWVSAGLLANAAVITTVGFILSCALCFALAARGFRASADEAVSTKQSVLDLGIGMLIAAPVFWMFTLILNVNLPSLTGTPWF